MDIILTQIMEILTNKAGILVKESQLNHFLEHFICRLVGQALEMLDTRWVEDMKKQGFKIDKRPKRQVTFFFGSVTFRRRCWIKQDHSPVYPIDLLLGILHKQRSSCYVQNVFAQASELGVFRRIAKAIGLVSPLSISHQQLQQMTKQVGLMIDANQTNDLRNNPQKGERKVPALTIEGDAFYIGRQGGGNLVFHRLQVCEGRQARGKQRSKLLGYHEIIDLDREKAFEQMEEYLEMTYDLTNTILITNSDDGSGYAKKDFDVLVPAGNIHEHFTDRFHVNKKIKERTKTMPEELTHGFQKALYSYDKDKLQPYYDTIASLSQTDSDKDDLKHLKAYIDAHWPYLKPFGMRPSLKGLKPVIGTCESHHRLFTFRMKKQGRRWSEEGAQAMAKIIAADRNGEFEKYSDYEPLPEAEYPEYDWNAYFREYQKPLAECRKTTKWDYSEVSQAHLVSSQLRLGFSI